MSTIEDPFEDPIDTHRCLLPTPRATALAVRPRPLAHPRRRPG
ncbi:hypothetical protein [Streptomyces sp. JJ38]|nr:hypothetical protein [Streptomyces sp. JJ38]